MNAKQKGNRGERELACQLRAYGYDCRRGQQFSGANGDADVVGLPGIHIEVKRVERLNITDAMCQAIGDSKGDVPVVMHRKNNEKWLVTMRFEDWIELYKEWSDG
jgi:Holliday junction resolvase